MKTRVQSWPGRVDKRFESSPGSPRGKHSMMSHSAQSYRKEAVT